MTDFARAQVLRALAGVAAFSLAACAHEREPSLRADQSPAQQTELVPYLVGLIVADLETSIRWYQHLGFDIAGVSEHPAEGLRIALLDHGAFRLELVQQTGSALAERPVMGLGFAKLTFQVADVPALAARLDGENFVVPVIENPQTGALSFIVRDPDGNWIGFEEPAPAP